MKHMLRVCGVGFNLTILSALFTMSGIIPIDGSPALYARAVEEVGGIDALFCEYFDQQYELLEVLQPEVVGHFDLIRMHDQDYHGRLERPEVKGRIRRNLERIKELESILDFNLRAFEKGGSEPYVSGSILEMAFELGIPCVPGDDSHGVAGVGLHVRRGIDILEQHRVQYCVADSGLNT